MEETGPTTGRVIHLPMPTFLIFKWGQCNLPIDWKAVVGGMPEVVVVAIRTE